MATQSACNANLNNCLLHCGVLPACGLSARIQLKTQQHQNPMSGYTAATEQHLQLGGRTYDGYQAHGTVLGRRAVYELSLTLVSS